MAYDRNSCLNALSKNEIHIEKAFEDNLKYFAYFLHDKKILTDELYSSVTDPDCRDPKSTHALRMFRRLFQLVQQNEKHFFKFRYCLTNEKYNDLLRNLDDAYKGEDIDTEILQLYCVFWIILLSILCPLFVILILLKWIFDELKIIIGYLKEVVKSLPKKELSETEYLSSASCGSSTITEDELDCTKKKCTIDNKLLQSIVDGDISSKERADIRFRLRMDSTAQQGYMQIQSRVKESLHLRNRTYQLQTLSQSNISMLVDRKNTLKFVQCPRQPTSDANTTYEPDSSEVVLRSPPRCTPLSSSNCTSEVVLRSPPMCTPLSSSNCTSEVVLQSLPMCIPSWRSSIFSNDSYLKRSVSFIFLYSNFFSWEKIIEIILLVFVICIIIRVASLILTSTTFKRKQRECERGRVGFKMSRSQDPSFDICYSLED